MEKRLKEENLLSSGNSLCMSSAEDEELMEKRLEEENLLSSGNSLYLTSLQRMRNSRRRGWKRRTFSL
jgi:hypothetical protein